MSSGPGGSGTGGSAPSQKHSIQCKYCDEKPLVKNYPAHLSRKHPNEDQNDRTGKGGQSLLTFFPKRSRSSDDADSKNKKRNCSGSGDSAIELEDRELEEDFGSMNLAPVNVSDEDADDVQQQSSSKAGGAGLQLAQSFLRITSSIIMIFCQFSNWGCQLQLQFSQPFLHQFPKSLCPSSKGDPDDSKTPPTC